jgi:hypothetical protein
MHVPSTRAEGVSFSSDYSERRIRVKDGGNQHLVGLFDIPEQANYPHAYCSSSLEFSTVTT